MKFPALTTAQIFSSLNHSEVAEILRGGGIGIVRTDTIYGIIARAADEKAVERVFASKGRDDQKSPIVLIARLDQMFDTSPAAEQQLTREVWPGKITVAHPAKNAPPWLTRGNSEFGYRMPDVAELRALIEAVGPLIAPSANLQGQSPALDIVEAINYFGDQVDFYVDGGRVTDSTPSQLLRINERGEIERLR